jgi:hypothetical protein
MASQVWVKKTDLLIVDFKIYLFIHSFMYLLSYIHLQGHTKDVETSLGHILYISIV